jgi:hypothetical protein
MKSINQIFKNNPSLLNEDEVNELVEYCLELEDMVVEYKQKEDKTVVLKQLITEIKKSCFDLLKEEEVAERWPNEFEKINFKEAIINLDKYISLYCQKNKIYL